ncbi:hypothetical protein JCM11251_007803 [Rhodosporidiobolus azoricus]
MALDLSKGSLRPSSPRPHHISLIPSSQTVTDTPPSASSSQRGALPATLSVQFGSSTSTMRKPFVIGGRGDMESQGRNKGEAGVTREGLVPSEDPNKETGRPKKEKGRKAKRGRVGEVEAEEEREGRGGGSDHGREEGEFTGPSSGELMPPPPPTGRRSKKRRHEDEPMRNAVVVSEEQAAETHKRVMLACAVIDRAPSSPPTASQDNALPAAQAAEANDFASSEFASSPLSASQEQEGGGHHLLPFPTMQPTDGEYDDGGGGYGEIGRNDDSGHFSGKNGEEGDLDHSGDEGEEYEEGQDGDSENWWQNSALQDMGRVGRTSEAEEQDQVEEADFRHRPFAAQPPMFRRAVTTSSAYDFRLSAHDIQQQEYQPAYHQHLEQEQASTQPALDPLASIPSLYPDEERPYIAHAVNLAQAKTRARDDDAEGGDGEEWKDLAEGFGQRFGGLVARMGGLLESSTTHHSSLLSTLSAHSSELDKTAQQLAETKKRLSGWGGMVLGSFQAGGGGAGGVSEAGADAKGGEADQ